MKNICLIIALLTFSCLAVTPIQDKKPRRAVAVTFDDLPATHGDLPLMREITKKLLATITANKIPAIGFVNESKLHQAAGQEAERTALLKAWLASGLELGNHTYSHIAIDNASLDAYQADVIRGEIVIKKLLSDKGKKLRYFRHTQLRTGPTPEYKQGLEKFLAERGYAIAPVTIDNNEYIFARIYAEAKQRGDQATAKRVAAAYLPYMEQIFAFFEKLSQETFGYEVKQTLLLHANLLNADYFDELAAMMKRRGYEFISLAEALKDKAYNLPDAQHRRGLSWLHRWRLAKGLPLKEEPSEPQFITQLFNSRQ